MPWTGKELPQLRAARQAGPQATPQDSSGSHPTGSGTRAAQPKGSDPASLKMQHEENLKRNSVGGEQPALNLQDSHRRVGTCTSKALICLQGPCEFLFKRGKAYTLVVEAKQDISTNWEANVCQVAAQMYTMLGANHDNSMASGVQQYLVMLSGILPGREGCMHDCCC